MKGDHMGILAADPTQRQLPLSNWTWFSSDFTRPSGLRPSPPAHRRAGRPHRRLAPSSRQSDGVHRLYGYGRSRRSGRGRGRPARNAPRRVARLRLRRACVRPTMPEPTPVQEIIIVRRRGYGDGDGHHGGVWKIAFADFMTAMMAFFLVLWIVHSTSKETRSSVARCFNPIKLADTTPARKGLNDPKDSDFDAAVTAPRAGAPKSKPEKNAPEHANEPSKADSKEKPAKDAQKV